jgi:hypothetical protein
MDENEKSWFEQVYGPTWRSLKDPETYKELLDLSSYGDAFGVPGAGEGLEEYVEDYAAPWWQSYDDDTPRLGGVTTQGKIDRAKDLLIDMPAHGIVNAAQWLKDLGTQGFEVIENLEPTWLGGEGRPLLTKEQKYKLDAWEGNPFGNYYVDEEGNVDNPYINPVYDEQGNIKGYNNQAYLRMKADSERRAQKEFNEKIFTPEVEKKLLAEVDKAITWEDWRTDKKNKKRHFSEFHKDKQDYYEQLISDRYDDKFGDLYIKNMDRSFMENYQIGYTDDEGRRVGDKGAFSDWDWSEDQWRPPHSMFGYNTDDKRFLRQMEIVPELAADYFLWKGIGRGSKALKSGSKRSYPSSGIKGALRIEDKDKYRFAEEWLKDRGAL